MAESGIPQQEHVSAKKVLCRYFIHGVCYKGSSCLYSHDKSGSVPANNICKFYRLGQCSFGIKCRYDHIKEDTKTVSFQPNRSPTVQTPTNTGRPGARRDTRRSNMVTLSKKGIDHSIRESQRKKDQNAEWAQAKPFVPGQKYHNKNPNTYAAAIGGNDSETTAFTFQNPLGWTPPGRRKAWGANGVDNYESRLCTGLGGLSLSAVTADTPLCPFYANGECQRDEECQYVHGDICDMCGLPQLHPANEKQREEHFRECLAEHEREMEKAFAHQASENKECGICLDKVLHKEPTPGATLDRRFGILENCNHCFCLTCIRQWRGNKEISIETHRSCPTCRTHSDFITPSKFWVETSEEKSKLIQDYKKALQAKPCQYFKKGKAECPFNRKCFYLHALPDGTVVEENIVKRSWRTNADGEHVRQNEEPSLWDYINNRDASISDLEDEIQMLLLDIQSVPGNDSD